MPGRPRVKQMFFMMYRPLVMVFHFPTVVWAGFLYGVSLSLYNVCNATISIVLSSSHCFLSPTSVGLAILALFVGSLFGALWTGYVGNIMTLHLARRNGIRELEQCLWIILGSGILGAVGFIL